MRSGLPCALLSLGGEIVPGIVGKHDSVEEECQNSRLVEALRDHIGEETKEEYYSRLINRLLAEETALL